MSSCQARCLQKHIKLNTEHIYLKVKGTRQKELVVRRNKIFEFVAF